MSPQTKAVKTANPIPVSVYPGSQTDELIRKAAYFEAEFNSLLNCYAQKDDENRKLRKKIGSLEKLIVDLSRKVL
jgi:hypothetical protein